MRNKIFIGIAMSLFAVVTVVNMSMVQSNGASDIPLENIAVMAQAQSEGGKIKVKEVHYPEPGDPNYGTVKCVCWGSGSVSCCN
jgi:hypothetical protein